jgi:perosamine synthetase
LVNAKHRIPITVPYLGEDEKKRVSEVIESGWLSQGPRVAEFEEKFASCVGSGYAVATTSCTTALHSALVVSGIGPGDEVIVPSLSFIATANSVVFCGATPVFADIDPETCNIDPDKIEGLITTKTRAVMPVHQMGLPADLDYIKEIADRHGLKVIEDAACAVGSKYKGRRVGGHGNIACFSFHPRKIITTGEGGMVTTDDADIASRLKRLRHQGMSVSDLERHAANKIIIETYPEIGYNYRMTDMQAAIGIEQLRKLDFIVERRRELAGVYDRGLGEVPHIRVPKVPGHVYHNYQSYWIELLDSCPIDRDTLMSELLDRGIATRRGIMAIHLEPCYRRRSKTLLPDTERITMKTLLLPLYPTIRSEEQEFVIDSVREIVMES